jgi:hypothetical protein
LTYLSYRLAIYQTLGTNASKIKIIGKVNAGILILEIVSVITKDRGMSVEVFSLKDLSYGTVLLALMMQWPRAENQPSCRSFLALISRGIDIDFSTCSNS